MDRRIPRRPVRLALDVAVAWACSVVLSTYLQVQPVPLVRMVAFGLLVWALPHAVGGKAARAGRVVWALVAAVLAATMVCGFHIHVEDAYSGHVDVNYLTPVSWTDAVAYPLLALGLYVLLCGLTYALGRVRCPVRLSPSRPLGRLGLRPYVTAAVLLAAWLPYLLAYWPGFVFGDTLVAAGPVFGGPWINHHPLLYSLFLKVCVWVAARLGFGHTVGFGLSTLIQMMVLALSLGYLVAWLVVRARLPRQVGYALAAVFALSPYVAAFSVAMWKDPIFTAGLVVVSLLLMDCVLTDGAVVTGTRWWLPLLVLGLVVSIFFRNNGLYVVALAAVALLCLWVRRGRAPEVRGLAHAGAVCAAVVAVSWVITGPVYRAAGVSGPHAETYGILINQMARVVVYDGDMSEEDRAYMDALLPLERYPEAYTPCCVDNVKWHPEFDDDVLADGFLGHWLSMLRRNPRLYVESWVLGTYGFWTVNCPDVNAADNNIGGGVPQNDIGSVMFDVFDVHPHNLWGTDAVRRFLPQDEWSLPLGWILWLLVYVAALLCMRRRGAQVVALAPSFGLMLTLVLASPLRYWPRYGILVQFLLPLYLAMLCGCTREAGEDLP